MVRNILMVFMIVAIALLTIKLGDIQSQLENVESVVIEVTINPDALPAVSAEPVSPRERELRRLAPIYERPSF